MIEIEIGTHGLFYAHDLFVTDRENESEIDLHKMHEHTEGGWVITIPEPEWQTPSQRV